MTPPRVVGLVVHGGRERSVRAAERTAKLLAAHDIAAVVADVDLGPGSVELSVVAEREFGASVDLALSFGGDGTFLRAAHRCRDAGVPVLGINLGRLGFLADVEVDELPTAIDAIARGQVTLEARHTLDADVENAAGEIIHQGWALNEISVEKTARQRLLQMEIHIGSGLFASVPADALILATSTGSTAYSLSAGGPIVSPSLNAVLVTPVAPHSLFDRTLVAAPDEQVVVRIVSDQEAAVISCDGRPPVTAPPGGAVRVRTGASPVVLARVESIDFYELVRRKFGLR